MIRYMGAVLAAALLVSPAYAAKQEKCVITKDQLLKVNEALGLGTPQEMPVAMRLNFVKKFNENPPHIGAPVDTVIIQQHDGIPLLRLEFFRGNCFVNMFDMPIQAFVKMVQESQGPAI